MGHEVRGVVAHGKGAPVTVETVQVPDPGPGEALVAVQACGVCYTDLHYRQGRINDEFPATSSSSTGGPSADAAAHAAGANRGTASIPTMPGRP
jgi:S-(hydroxymethyl)mycothiol dehydrogenase